MRPYYLPLAVLILLTAAGLRLHQLHSLPPGPHYDEAANILITRSITFDGANLFPIANSYQGRESLYFYLSAPVFRFVADDVFGLRLVSVFSNLITIAASIALGRAMFRGDRGLVIGLVAGVLMALSFHQLLMSRQAYRAVTLPLMQALGLFFLWRGLRSDRLLWLVVGGVFSAGALYTYMASRLFPLWLLLAGGVLLGLTLWLDRRQFRRRVVQGGVFFGVMALAALPMAVYALENPDIFFQRLTEVSGSAGTGEAVTLAQSIRLHLEMFFIRGDFGNLRYNIPGRPYFTLPEGLLLLVGLAVAGWRLASVVSGGRLLRSEAPPVRMPNGASVDDAPLQRTAYFLLLLSPLMVIPSVIALGGLPPSHMRSLGMVPLVFIAVAVGFEALLPRRLVRYLPFGIVAVLLTGGILLADAYLTWAKRADLFYQADGDLAAAVRWLPEQTADDTPVYIAAYHREHPTVLSGTDQPVTWLGTDSLFLPPPGRDALVIFAHSTPPPPDWAALLADYRLMDVPSGPDGGPAFWAYRLPSGVTLDGLTPPQTVLQNPFLRYAGSTGTPVTAGAAGEVTLAWDVLQTPPYARLRPILEVRAASGVLLASSDLYLLGTNRWLPGETALYRMPVMIPPGTPPGEYPMTVTWVDRDTEAYLSYYQADGIHAGIAAELGTVRVEKPPVFPAVETLTIPVRQVVDVLPGVRLLGWDTPPEVLRSGERFNMTLYWQAVPGTSRPPDLSLTAVLDGRTFWQEAMAYAPANWDDGEIITQHLRWRIPHDQEAGQVALGLRVADQSLTLGTVIVESVPREFVPPPVETTVNIALEGMVRLYGYSLDVSNGVQLTLVWTSQAILDEDYTVFVHLVDAQGGIIDQHDRMPPIPTTLWAVGQVITDVYRFDVIPDGDWSIRLGLYNQETGKRLSMYSNNNQVKDFIEID